MKKKEVTGNFYTDLFNEFDIKKDWVNLVFIIAQLIIALHNIFFEKNPSSPFLVGLLELVITMLFILLLADKLLMRMGEKLMKEMSNLISHMIDETTKLKVDIEVDIETVFKVTPKKKTKSN